MHKYVVFMALIIALARHTGAAWQLHDPSVIEDPADAANVTLAVYGMDACYTSCDNGYLTAIRWGSPGVTCDISIVGSVAPPGHPDLGPDDLWVDIEFNMMVFSGTRSVEYQQDMLNAGEYSRDGWSCTPFQSTTLPPVGHTPAVVVSLVFCAGFDGVAVRSGGDVADINATVIINATVTVKDTGALLGVIPVWSVSFQQPDNECVMLPEVYTLIVTCVLCAIVPFATFFLWPLPNPDTEPADGKAEKEEEGKQQIITLGSINAGEEAVVAASLARPSRLAKLWGHLKLAAIDPYMWGSLMYLVAAGLYMWGRWWPDYLANHQVFNDVLWIAAAGVYVLSAVLYHISWEGFDRNLNFVEVWEVYCNLIGCIGFNISAVMYLWGDVPSIVTDTAWFEFVMYIICLFEAIFCVLTWWFEYRSRPEYETTPALAMVWDAGTSLAFWAVFLDLFSGVLYMMSSCAGLWINKRSTVTIDSAADVLQWSDHGVFSPPEQVTTIAYNTMLWGQMADTAYFVDSFLFIAMCWREITAEEEPAEEEEEAGTAKGKAGVSTRKSTLQEAEVALLDDVDGEGRPRAHSQRRRGDSFASWVDDEGRPRTFSHHRRGSFLARTDIDANAEGRPRGMSTQRCASVLALEGGHALDPAQVHHHHITLDDLVGGPKGEEEEKPVYYYRVRRNVLIDCNTFWTAVLCCRYRRFDLWGWLCGKREKARASSGNIQTNMSMPVYKPPSVPKASLEVEAI